MTRIAITLWLGLIGAMSTFLVPEARSASCRSGNGCRALIPLADGMSMPAFTSHTLAAPGAGLRRAVIVIHGSGRTARSYFKRMMRATERAGKVGQTLVIAPHFTVLSDINERAAGELYWERNSHWKQGEESARRGGRRISAFAVIDQLRARLRDRHFFPALSHLVVIGHSAGGQFVQRYAVGNSIEEGHVRYRVRYIVANPSSYMYFDDHRPDGDGFARQLGGPSCPVNVYKYGIEGRNNYMSRAPVAEMAARYRQREVLYLLGGEDKYSDARSLDRRCAARAQGPHRLARARNYMRYMDRFHTPHRHRLSVVPGIGHSSRRIFLSNEGMDAVFGW
ncbi:MAG: pimeloyl-ACP methyl ester carboxylesterase [Alphaproteobacteria bacterium]|jgi:pimeloyl-ACP methyl ester carboxylesterase